MLCEDNSHCLKQILKLIKDIYGLKSVSVYVNTYTSLKLVASEPLIIQNDIKILSLISRFNHNHKNDYYQIFEIVKTPKKQAFLLLESDEVVFELDEKINNFLEIIASLCKDNSNVDKQIDNIKYFINIDNTSVQEVVDLLLENKYAFRFILDPKEMKIYVNNNFFRMLDFDTIDSFMDVDVIRKNLSKKDEHEISINVDRLLAGEINYFKYDFILKNNDKYHLTVHFLDSSHYKSKENLLNGIISISCSKSYFQNFINKSRYKTELSTSENIGIWEYDYINKELLFCSNTLKILGINKTKVKLQDFISINPEKNYKAIRKLIRESKKVFYDEITDFNFEIEVINFLGEEKYLEIAARKIKEFHNETMIIGLIKDITVDLLKDSSNLQLEKLQSLGSLAGSIAHDFNNILMASFGYIGMLKKIPNMPKQAIDYINGLDSVSRTAAVLAKRLLTFSRSDNYYFETIDLIELVKETIEVLKHLMPPNISIGANYHIEQAYIMGNTADIQNILINIAINSKDAMPNGGLLNFKISSEFLNEIDPTMLNNENFMVGEYVVIDIIDTGMGIKKEDNNKIFEPFYTTKAKNSGTGLGLSTVLKTVKKCNGMLKFTSVVNAGTIFSIYLPKAHGVVEERKNDLNEISLIELHKKTRNFNIMVVDDEDIVRTIVVESLENIGLKVYGFGHPLEAIRFYSEHYRKIDLVILDMMMPIMSGEDTFNNLKQINPQVLTIVLSGFSSEGMVNKMLNSGAIDYLEKPISIDELCYKVVKALDEKDTSSILDESAALAMLANNQKVYIRLLGRYYEEYKDINYEILKYTEQKEYSKVRAIIHKIKGISLNLGAKELHTLSDEIEQDIINNTNIEQIDEKINHFTVLHTLVLEEISKKINA